MDSRLDLGTAAAFKADNLPSKIMPGLVHTVNMHMPLWDHVYIIFNRMYLQFFRPKKMGLLEFGFARPSFLGEILKIVDRQTPDNGYTIKHPL